MEAAGILYFCQLFEISLLSSSSGSVSLALFDSRLDSLRLPMVRQVADTDYLGEQDNSASPKPESVSVYTQVYFEWIVNVDEGEFSVPDIVVVS